MKLNPQTTAFIFPGQGSQTVGMGSELAAQFPDAKEVFDEADSTLGFSLSNLMWAGPDTELNETINTQPALYVHSIAAWSTFTRLYPDFKPVAVAGHSLGELSALTASGALGFSDGLKLVRTRGELMKRAGLLNPGGMAARSEEHTSELQSQSNLVCRLLLEKKKEIRSLLSRHPRKAVLRALESRHLARALLALEASSSVHIAADAASRSLQTLDVEAFVVPF